MREVRRAAIQAQKNCKETLPRARRLMKEVSLYWKKYDKVEKEHRKRAEKEALEQRKLDEEMREVKELIVYFVYCRNILCMELLDTTPSECIPTKISLSSGHQPL